MIRGKGSNPRISNVNRPHDPGGGGGGGNLPLSSKDTRNDVRWKLIMDRYGKPVLSPNYKTDIPISECSVGKESLDKFVPETNNTSCYVTRRNPVSRDRIEQPRPPPVRGVGITSAGQTRNTRRNSVAAGPATVIKTTANTVQTGYNTQNTELANGDWHKVMRKHRYMKSIRNQDYRMVASEMDKFETPRTNRAVVADQCTSPGDAIRPDGRPAEGLARGGLQSLETIEGDDRCLNCHKRKKRYRTGRSSGHVRKRLSARLRPWSGRSPRLLNVSVPLVTQRIPSVVRETMHYEWIGRKSGTDADLPVPYNYLEIPAQMLPNAFLQLAEEARELVVIEESSGFLEDVQSGASQWSGPPLMGVLTGGHHGPFGRESVDHVVTPGRLVGKRRIASVDSGSLLDNWRTREDICDESGLVPEFRPVRNDRNTATVVSGNRGFHRKERQVRRDRSGPVGKQIMSEPSARFVHKSAYMSDTAVRPEGQDGCFEGPTMVSRQYDSPSEGQGIDRPVNAERRVYTSAGPLGFRVTLGGQITDWPDPVEPPGTMQQVIFPRPTADREGSDSPAATGWAENIVTAGCTLSAEMHPIAVRRSVDVDDAVGLEVGGPVGRFPYSELRQTDVESILHSNRRDDVVASRSGTTEHPDDRSGDIDCADTTYDESDKFAGEWDPLVEKDNGCQLVRVNGGLDDCLTNSRDVSGSSDSGVQSWMEQWDNMSDNSMDGSYVDTGDLHRSVSDELARLLFDAPPNTEDEDASGSPGTDGSVMGMLHKCQPEAMFDDDRNLSCNDMTDSEYDSNSDLEEHSDVSDDSSVLGIRKCYDAECLIVVGRPCQGRAVPGPRGPLRFHQGTGRNSGCLNTIRLGVLGHVGLMGI